MTKQDYINQVAHLPREEQRKALENMYNAECEIDDYSANALTLCEILAFDYNSWSHIDILPHFYYDIGEYQKCIDFVLSQPEDNVISITKYYLVALAYEQLGNCEGAIQFSMRSNQLLLDLVSNGGQTQRPYNTLPKESTDTLFSNYLVAGKAWYKLNKYKNAYDCFNESWTINPTICSAFYLGLILCDGLGLAKDIKEAEGYFIAVDTHSKDSTELGIANYKLGVIYATENGFVNREKAEAHLQKAKSLGYAVSDEEIASLLNNIPAPKKKSFFGALFG